MIRCKEYEVDLEKSNDDELASDLLCIIEALHCKCFTEEQIRAITEMGLRQNHKDIDNVEVKRYEA